MKTAYFDCIFGVAGDMILGALVANGVPIEHLRKELGKLGIGGFELSEKQKKCSGITAVKINVITTQQNKHRHLSHIKDIISASDVSEWVKDRAIRIFTRLAEAEAIVHGTSPEEVHFHEVGALDAIVDVVGSCIGLEYLNVKYVVSTPIYLGTGSVRCAHGVMPVPVPAVVELTKGIPVVRTAIEGEITTPTGAAIVTTLASSYGMLDNFVPGSVGYGAGTKEWEDHPNIIRITIGEAPGTFESDQLLLLETNIDDMNPEVYGYLTDCLLEAGAKDVYMTPIYMKKGRPGTILSVLADDFKVNELLEMILKETTTLGVRITRVIRKKLKRESKTVETEFGPVRIKAALVDGYERWAPEFEDCARIAREKGVPLLDIYGAIQKKHTPD